LDSVEPSTKEEVKMRAAWMLNSAPIKKPRAADCTCRGGRRRGGASAQGTQLAGTQDAFKHSNAARSEWDANRAALGRKGRRLCAEAGS
jgi:hypothetical protein